jgi:hypothetical protein
VGQFSSEPPRETGGHFRARVNFQIEAAYDAQKVRRRQVRVPILSGPILSNQNYDLQKK